MRALLQTTSSGHIGGVINIEMGLSLPTADYIDITLRRSPQTVGGTDLDREISLSVGLLGTGDITLSVLRNRIRTATVVGNVPTPNHITIYRTDIFKWNITVQSGSDALYTKTVNLDMQTLVAEYTDTDEPLMAEAGAAWVIELYTDNPSVVSSFDLKADNSAWQ